jgi:hypothetical protein
VAVPRGNRDDRDGGGDPSPQPWYNRTPEVVGATVAALALIGMLVLAISFVAGRFNEPTEAPLDFVEPTFSATETQSRTPTATTGTITSTSPPQTTEINDPAPTSGSETTSSAETTTTTETTTTSPTTTRREADEDDEEEGETTTRTTRRPRTNVTRTLYPLP